MEALLENLVPKIFHIYDRDREIGVVISFQTLTILILPLDMINIKNTKTLIKKTNKALIKAITVNIPDHMITLIVFTLTNRNNISFQKRKKIQITITAPM